MKEFKGLSQAELANYLKDKGLTISRETISKMENGSRNISIIELKAISEVFDVTTDFFFRRRGKTLVSLFRKKSTAR
ncbi:helix-turn-helix transcriptional regulator [Anaerobacillus sp. HL2]|nr:helix-turn-helix transcriptional regulator [Anaerobacillus sp. HL2]